MSARKRLDDARAQHAQVQGTLALAEQALADYDNDRVSRRVTEFYREQIRLSSGGLGPSVIPIVRDDFAALAESATRAMHAGPSMESGPHVERIVVYVDDLDRCPPSTVVGVLQATQLLLAFPLFVVVIAIDPRWLVHAVGTRFGGTEAAARDGESAGASPADRSGDDTRLAYLDQAFDVPFSMLPLDRRGAYEIVRILVEPLQEAPELPISASIAEPAVAAPALTRDDHDEEDTVEALRLTMEEIAAIERVGALTLQSVRQARRLLTAYLLVRATVPHHDLGRFLGSASARAAYRAVLAQLAIVVSAARLAPRYFRVLASANPGDVSALLGALAADCAVLSDGEWPVLQAVLEDYRAQGDDAEAIGDLIAWSPVAGRHSFAFAVDGR